MPAGRIGNRIRPMSRPPAVVEINAVPTTLVPKSSGCCSARDKMVMPPIEWPISTTGAVTGEVVDHPRQVAAELLDRRVALGRAPRAAVRALVVEHRPDLAAVARTLEVPAVEAEGVAVDEDECRRQFGTPALGGGPGQRGVRLVHLGVQRDPVVGHHRDRLRAQAAELDPVADVAVRDLPTALHQACGDTRGGQPGGAGGDPQDPAASPHRVSSRTPTCRRGIRPLPIRVTIS